jgi:hypothetical protein
VAAVHGVSVGRPSRRLRAARPPRGTTSLGGPVRLGVRTTANGERDLVRLAGAGRARKPISQIDLFGPTWDEFFADGQRALRHAVDWYGGAERWASKLGVELKPHRGTHTEWSYVPHGGVASGPAGGNSTRLDSAPSSDRSDAETLDTKSHRNSGCACPTTRGSGGGSDDPLWDSQRGSWLSVIRTVAVYVCSTAPRTCRSRTSASAPSLCSSRTW